MMPSKARQSPFRGWPSESKAPGFDERLDGPFVEGARIYPAAEVVEVGEGPPGFAGRHDVLDDGLANVSHRGEAEDDHPRPSAGASDPAPA